MPYSTTITALDFSGGGGDVRVTAGYAHDVLGIGETRQDSVNVDIPYNQFTSGNANPFSYAGNLAPPPASHWDIGLWIQEIATIPAGGVLFRSGRYQTEPPQDPIEVILAPPVQIGAAELAGAVGTLPMTSGSTTISTLATTVVGRDIAIVAGGTDTGLPAGVTFTFSATMVLLPNADLQTLDTPIRIRLDNATLGFIAGVGTGFVTALLNAVSGIIVNQVVPRLRSQLESTINASVLSTVAARLNRGMPAALPAGVVISIRRFNATTRPLGAGTEPIIEVRGAIGAFGGVTNKFPALSSGGTCFIATAATHAQSPEVLTLRRLRDGHLRTRVAGRCFIKAYEFLSPPVARVIARSRTLRSIVRLLVVAPAARMAKLLMEQERRR